MENTVYSGPIDRWESKWPYRAGAVWLLLTIFMVYFLWDIFNEANHHVSPIKIYYIIIPLLFFSPIKFFTLIAFKEDARYITDPLKSIRNGVNPILSFAVIIITVLVALWAQSGLEKYLKAQGYIKIADQLGSHSSGYQTWQFKS